MEDPNGLLPLLASNGITPEKIVSLMQESFETKEEWKKLKEQFVILIAKFEELQKENDGLRQEIAQLQHENA